MGPFAENQSVVCLVSTSVLPPVRMISSRILILAPIVLVLAPTAFAENGEIPPDALSLHAPLFHDSSSKTGPKPVSEIDGLNFVEEDGRRFLRLVKAAPGTPDVALAWPAREIISNTQGSISFWIRFRTVSPSIHSMYMWGRKQAPVPFRLVSTGGGHWHFMIEEIKYEPPAKGEKPPEKLKLEDTDVEETLKAKGSELIVEEKDFLKELKKASGEKTPLSTFNFISTVRPFPENGLGGEAPGYRQLFEETEWHHVAYTWRSVNHRTYLDGLSAGGAGGDRTFSRMAEIIDDKARLELRTEDVDIADLRVYRRALSDEEIKTLSSARADEYLEVNPRFEVWADWAPTIGRTVVYANVSDYPTARRVDVSCVNAGDGNVLHKAAMYEFPGGIGEQVVKVFEDQPFPAGKYCFDAVVFDAGGKQLAKARSTTRDVDKPNLVWFGFEGGLKKNRKIRILAPYTPLGSAESEISTVTATYHLAQTGLPKSIAVKGSELLAAPIRLDVVSEGQSLEFTGGKGLSAITNEEDQASWQSESESADGHRLSVDAFMEYDGVVRFDVTLSPKDALKADSIELRIPYRPELARLAHLGYSWYFMSLGPAEDGTWNCKSIHWGGYSQTRFIRRPGVLFDSNDFASMGHPGRPPARFNYIPYLHVGNHHRGLSWFVDNDRNWIHGGAPAVEFVARGDETFLRAHLVGRETELRKPITFRFYLLANPFKPLPKDWRTWDIADYQQRNAVSRRTQHQFWWHWGEYAQNFYPYPGGVQGTSYESWQGKFKGGTLRHIPFINFGSPGGFSFWNEEHKVLPFSWKLHNTRAHQDYMMYWMDRCHREIGIRGVYIDEPYVEPFSYNVLAGDAAYIHSDGTRSMGYRYMEARETMRRYKQLFTELGEEVAIWVHNTAYRPLPIYTFADIGMDGEHPQFWVTQWDNYHVWYNGTFGRGYIAGQSTGVVGTMMYHHTSDARGPNSFQKVHTKNRQYLSVTLPFGILPMKMTFDAELDRTNNIREAFGIFDEGLEDYWVNDFGQVMPDTGFSTWFYGATLVRNRKRNRAMLYLSYPNLDQSARTEVKGRFDKLDLGKPNNHAWHAETGVSVRIEDKMFLDHVPDDFGAIWIEGHDAPQKPRPDGAILGVSFDKNLEADFGGGFRAVEFSGAEADPEPVAGHTGHALPIGPGIKAVGYSVVPSWIAGSLEMRVRVDEVGEAPLQLVVLRHHLETSLSLVRTEGGSPAVLVITREQPLKADPTAWAYAIGNQGQTFEKLLPVPELVNGKWHMLSLSWQSGQYQVYWEGKMLGELSRAVGPRLRDTTAPASGVWLGDGRGETSGKASIDSVIVYDWGLAERDLATRKDAVALTPIKRPPTLTDFGAWGFIKDPQNISVVANFRSHENFGVIVAVECEVFAKGNLKQSLAKTTLYPWQGFGWGSLSFTELPKISQALDLKIEDAPEEDDDLAELSESVDAGVREWILRFKLRGVRAGKPFDAGLKEISLKHDFIEEELGK